MKKIKSLQMFFVLTILLVVMACGGGDDSEDGEDTDISDVAGTYDKVTESDNCSDFNLENVLIIEQDGENLELLDEVGGLITTGTINSADEVTLTPTTTGDGSLLTGEGTIQNGIFESTLTINDVDCETTYELRD